MLFLHSLPALCHTFYLLHLQYCAKPVTRLTSTDIKLSFSCTQEYVVTHWSEYSLISNARNTEVSQIKGTLNCSIHFDGECSGHTCHRSVILDDEAVGIAQLWDQQCTLHILFTTVHTSTGGATVTFFRDGGVQTYFMYACACVCVCMYTYTCKMEIFQRGLNPHPHSPWLCQS